MLLIHSTTGTQQPLLHGCFSHFLDCTNGNISCKALYIPSLYVSLCLLRFWKPVFQLRFWWNRIKRILQNHHILKSGWKLVSIMENVSLGLEVLFSITWGALKVGPEALHRRKTGFLSNFQQISMQPSLSLKLWKLQTTYLYLKLV